VAGQQPVSGTDVAIELLDNHYGTQQAQTRRRSDDVRTNAGGDASLKNQRNRYEVVLLDRQQTDGVHLMRTVAEFQRAVQ
jgi:hypothetical protein